MFQIPHQKIPDPRDQVHVMRLAVQQAKPAEDAKNPKVALRPEDRIGSPERGLILPGGRDISCDHPVLDRRRHIAAGILQHRYQIIGRVTLHRVLKIQQPHACRSGPFGQPDQVLGMVIPLDQNGCFTGMVGK